MTRESDAFLTLRARSDIANLARADLFVSIHANASVDRSRQGFETYVLSPEALDIDARALRTVVSSKATARTQDPRLDRLIADVERGLAHRPAVSLATAIQKAMASARPNVPNRGVKQESMHVLLGARMPAVLVEFGFVDHPVEGKELESVATQSAVAKAIADGILAHADAVRSGT